jgi:hypothetical protein
LFLILLYPIFLFFSTPYIFCPVLRIKLVDFYKFGQKEEPFEQINAEKISQAREQLTRSVLGQNHAIEAVTNMGVADLQYESLKMQLLKHWLRLVSRCMQNSISYPD